MTILISGRDSFTYGNELDDCTPKRFSEYTWAADLATHLGMSYDCTVWGGHGNSKWWRGEHCLIEAATFLTKFLARPFGTELSFIRMA